MDFLFLHGAPSSGKLTVAKEILSAAGGRLFDNHAAIDLALTVFDFGTPGFWSLVKSVRLETIRQAATHGVPLLIFTSCYSHPEDYEQFQAIEKIVNDAGGRMLPAFLECDPAKLAARVGGADRAARGKLRDEAGLNQFLSEWNIVPVPHAHTFRIDSGAGRARETALKIMKHFGLESLPG